MLRREHSLDDMERSERKRACCQHCCLKYVIGEMMTNQSFRKRLGLSDTKADTTLLS